ncbi:methylated-DNA--[protein]-cysteine S-methyltransferase [Roseateles koreensis]|uniref:Methylated-DNA--[protein]-cysteine S-methyltransferase n=1 Tax=Roseateles koreensis TaxID=2987526 RepID=A0ABT5KVX7_9BURK|nr:methylated-DNA--[protein]-cysteine S-methyltransferase [Roseateles koreensis]MDC8786595.1 methylated-DNA--[protein]-cysteine S-methyltransferase [Roseateles koreensis]
MNTSNSKGYQTVRQAIEAITRTGTPLSLEQLAQAAGQSPAHFQRSFVSLAGVSPKEFAQSLSLSRAKARLQDAGSVLDAALEAGLSGPSRLHDLFLNLEGLTPGEFKRAGAGLQIGWSVIDSPLGPVWLAATERSKDLRVLRAAFLGQGREQDELHAAQAELPEAQWQRDDATLSRIGAELQRRLSGGAPQQRLGLMMNGTPLRLKVWQALMQLPEGQLLSYGQLAQQVGAPQAVRAVASCVAVNPIAYLVPCHRVIRASAQLGEYRWGPETKRALIGLELARHPGPR